ncbi:MAG: 50S ribosomal protein L4 [Promethearchaeota archaeon]
MVKKINVLGLDGKKKGSIDLPNIFSIIPRLDLIERAVNSTQAAQKQPQGRDPLAGKRNTALSWGTGYATARVPRIRGSGFMTSRNAGFAPGVVGGRLAHPPRAEKIITKKINRKEKHLALLSAISATEKPDLVLKRGHKIDKKTSLPIVIDDKIQTIKKTTQIVEILHKIGLTEELERVKNNVSIRAGKGKRRGRKYKKRKGPLIVIKDNFGIYKAARNIPGVEIIKFENLNCNLLAPGTHCGRLTIWTQSAFNQLKKYEVN